MRGLWSDSKWVVEPAFESMSIQTNLIWDNLPSRVIHGIRVLMTDIRMENPNTSTPAWLYISGSEGSIPSSSTCSSEVRLPTDSAKGCWLTL
jgi:hypothetical protein